LSGAEAVPQELSPARIGELLRSRRFGRSIEVVALTDSTNDDARAAATRGVPDGHVVVADAQRSGRGSQGRSWASPPGLDLYLSIVARPALSLSQLPPLTLAVGLGVAEAAEALTAKAPRPGQSRVKWPNDVWIDGRKCAGILVEATSVGEALQALVVGIGLNVNRSHWPEQLRDRATSLKLASESPTPLDRAVALCRTLEAVERWIDNLVEHGSAAVARAVDQRLLWRDQRVRCDRIEGELLGVADSGALRIATAAGMRELVAGQLVAIDDHD